LWRGAAGVMRATGTCQRAPGSAEI
jgi:hypothetical protein